MRGYIEQRLWSELEVTKPMVLWVASVLLRIPPELIAKHRRRLPSLIYQVYMSFGWHENKYVMTYNAARADLTAKIVPPPVDDEPLIRIDTEPEGDTSYWLASHVLGFKDEEIAVLCGISEDSLQDPKRDILPLLKSAYRILKKIKLKDPDVQQWHRSRHIMLRYFLDAEYHEI